MTFRRTILEGLRHDYQQEIIAVTGLRFQDGYETLMACSYLL